MSITGVGSSSSLMAQSLADMRARLADLQRQLGTGMKSDDYAGIGLERGLAVALRTQLSTLSGFGDSITKVGVRLDLAQTALGRMVAISHTVKSATQLTAYELDGDGQTTGQKTARSELDEMLGLLNTQAGDRYLFSGRAGDKPAVETTDHILDGDGARAGFKQIVSERKQADLGATGLGRLVIPAAAGTLVSMSEDVAGSPFGFKLSAIVSGLTNATVTGPAGVPPAVSVNFAAGQPNAGETVTFTFALPDGSSEKLVLTATASATPKPNEFTIGSTTAATAANLQATLTAAVGKLARTALTAASAVAAAADFFAIDDANPPRRVAGPPFATATALVAGTPANTVSWYTGEAGTQPARSTATARVDQAIVASYGVRANEQAIHWTVQNIAAYAVMTFSASDSDGAARYAALSDRVGTALAMPPGVQKIEHIQGELAAAQATLAAATDRHRQTQSTLGNMLQQVEGVPQELVAAQILALQTRLQASLQTTAMLHQISLINYL